MRETAVAEGAIRQQVIADRYLLIEPLGSGGMGEVWRGRDELLQRSVAIKLLDRGDDETVARFMLEARAQACIDHDHVAKVYDAGVGGCPDRDVLYLVMELLVGPSLYQRLARHRRLDVRTSVQIGDQVAAGLAAAHRAGIVHRDIKPANLMFDSQGRLKVLDFGVAWRLGVTDRRLTAAGQAVGTAAYMSPEQAAGGVVDRASDVYSLGCVLFEMLTGRWVFLGESRLELVVQRLNANAPRVSELVDVPGPLDGLIATMLVRDPEQRPTMAHVRQALHDIHAGRGPATVVWRSPQDVRPVVPKAPARARLPAPLRAHGFERSVHPRLVIAATAMVVVFLVLLAALEPGEPSDAEPPDDDPRGGTMAPLGG